MLGTTTRVALAVGMGGVVVIVGEMATVNGGKCGASAVGDTGMVVGIMVAVTVGSSS